ncbi:glycosyltransferase family 4 protein [Listeria booriae]|uniref:Glycosyltransferase family 4 protein n=1 Tax=Listeria booriae TaxID=1552123 RepID=A0A841Y6G4_9LIST|nr:glycosyltransferase [Listeria booriae]MBC1372005.1 glycosyltransferase family 4 protein [Listeria booriae]
MRQKVVMLLFNNFSNDARVLKEGKTLAKAGYWVELICVQEPKKDILPQTELVAPFFYVTRVGGKKNPYVIWMISLVMFIFGVSLIGQFVLAVAGIMLLFVSFTSKGHLLIQRTMAIITMAFVARSRKADYFQAHDLNTLPQAHFAARSRREKSKLIYDSHEVQTSREGCNGFIYRMIEQFYIHKIDLMIVENNTRAAFNEKLYGFLPGVIHNYPEYVTRMVGGQSIHRLLELPPNEKILLYQGVINPGRGLEKLIEAVPLFQEGTLVFIGDGRQKQELQARVAEHGLADCVKFIDKVPLHELRSYTQQAFLGFQVLNNTCFNHYSASSNKLFEYILAEVPVVSCEFPEIKKVVEGDRVGVCVDSHCPKAIATGVNDLLQNTTKYQMLKKNTRRVKKKYTWDKEQIKLEHYYKTLGTKEKNEREIS